MKYLKIKVTKFMDRMKYEELKNKVLAEDWDFNNEAQRKTILTLLADYPFYHKGYGSSELLDRAAEYINGNIQDKDKQKGILQFLISDKCKMRGLLQTENNVLDIVNVYKLLGDESTRKNYADCYEDKLLDAYKEIMMNYQYMDLTDMSCLTELLKNYNTFASFIKVLGSDSQIILALALYSEEAKNNIEYAQREKLAFALHTDIIYQSWFFNKNRFTAVEAYELYRNKLNEFPSPLDKEIDSNKLYKDIQACYFKTLMFKACYVSNERTLTENSAPVSYNLLMISDLPDLTAEEAEQLITLIDKIRPNELQQRIKEHALNFIENPKPC